MKLRVLLIVRCPAIVVLASLLMLWPVSADAQRITLSGSSITWEQLIDVIKAQTGYSVFTQEDIRNARPIAIQANKMPLAQFLELITRDEPFYYRISSNTVFLIRRKPALPGVSKLPHDKAPVQLHPVTGWVFDSAGAPLEYTAAVLLPVKKGDIAGPAGYFSIENVKPGSYIMEFSMLGYETLRKTIAVTGDGPLNMGRIILKQAAASPPQAFAQVFTGYQRIPQERATGAFGMVSASQLRTRLQANVVERMEGMVAGLVLMNGRDLRTTDDALTIRGVSTLFGTKRPLLVLDNFPFSGDILSVNPEDVTNITVLKDAAAASVWGARAANGVIVITTRRPAKGHLQVNYTTSFQWQPKPDLTYLQRLSTPEEISLEKFLNYPERAYSLPQSNFPFSKFAGLYIDSVTGTITPAAFAASVDSLSRLDNTAQVKELMMQQPFIQIHNINVTGGKENAGFYASLMHTNTHNINMNEKSKSFNLYIKGSIRPLSSLTIDLGFNLLSVNNREAGVDVARFYKHKSYEMLVDKNGRELPVNRIEEPLEENNNNIYSIARRSAWGLDDETYYPLRDMRHNEITGGSVYHRTNLAVKYRIVNGVEAGISYQLEKSNAHRNQYLHADHSLLVTQINNYVSPQMDEDGNMLLNPDGTLFNPVFNLPKGAKRREEENIFTAWQLRGFVNVNKTWGNYFNLAAVAGGELSSDETRAAAFSRYGYDAATGKFTEVNMRRLQLLNNLLGDVSPYKPEDYTSRQDNRYVSGFTNASVTYRKKYITSASVRIDDTNLFGTDPAYRYRPMWSAGAAWVISAEPWMRQFSLINYLQLRATSGINGNIPKTSGPFMIAEDGVNNITGDASLWIVTPANNKLRWEKTAINNIGIDYSFLGNRIQGKLDYYNRKSSDLLGSQELNPTRGFTSAILNLGTMDNKGWELELTTKLVTTKHFAWHTTFLYACNRNQIDNIGLGNDVRTPVAMASTSPYVAGKPYGAIYSFRFAGLSHDYGQIRLLNAQGEIAPDQYHTDLSMVTYSGTARPVHSGSYTNTFRFKQFELHTVMVFYAGFVQRQNIPRAYIEAAAFDGRLKYAWKKSGDEAFTKVPNLEVAGGSEYAWFHYADLTDAFLFNASYVKLRDVLFRYTFPEKVLSGSKIKKMSIYANVRNILTWTKNDMGIDTEAFEKGQRTLPVMPAYGLGCSVSF